MFAILALTCCTRWLARALATAAFCLVAGCATMQNGDPRDPYEGFNRAMFSFNQGFDESIGKPVAIVYSAIFPLEVRARVRNFFSNIQDVMIGVNNLLQGKPGDTVNDWARVVFNTTFGLAGIHDVASEMGLEKHNEDFGQTFAVWGMEPGPYFVWPFFGPNTVRDTVGLALDLYAAPVLAINPDSARYAMAALFLVNERADLLDATNILDDAALDRYLARRDAYFQRRRDLIYDGNPPRPPRERPPGREPRSEATPTEPDAASQQRAHAPAGTFLPQAPSNDDAAFAATRGNL